MRTELSRTKIGYFPNSTGLQAPGDRRRFVFFARETGIPFELADPGSRYDIVYLTASCNVSRWTRYKEENPGSKIIFELIDSYLLEDPNLKLYAKGAARFLKGREEKFYLDYRKALIKMIRVADAVVCSTPLQRDHIMKYNRNVHISLDHFSDDIRSFKTNYEKKKPLRLIWEGQGYTVSNVFQLKEALAALGDEVELHIITDPVIRYPFRIFDRSVEKMLKELPCKYVYHAWEKPGFSALIAGADLALIPIDRDDKLMWNKPENKLLLFWEIGIPVLSTGTPAYERVMKDAGLDYYCRSDQEWEGRIRSFIARDSAAVSGDMQRAKNYLALHHDKDLLIRKWNEIFESVLS